MAAPSEAGQGRGPWGLAHQAGAIRARFTRRFSPGPSPRTAFLAAPHPGEVQGKETTGEAGPPGGPSAETPQQGRPGGPDLGPELSRRGPPQGSCPAPPPPPPAESAVAPPPPVTWHFTA